MPREIARKLGDAVPEAVLAAAPDGAIVFMNGPARATFVPSGADPEALSAADLLPGLPLDGDSRAPSGSAELLARREDGAEFPAQVSHWETSIADREVTIAIVRDLTEQRRAEEELRRTRDRLAEAQRLARIGSWEWDLATNRVAWSDELYRIFGLEPGEFEPSYEGYLDRIHPDDRDAVEARNDRALADHQPFEDVRRCLRPDGSIFLLRSQGEVIADEDGNPVRMVGVCEDVTAEKEAERVEAELAAIVRSSLDAIVARGVGGEITSWSPGATSLYGYEPEEAIGRPFEILLPEERREDDAAGVARLLAGEPDGLYHETQMRRRDGSLVDVAVRLSPVRDRDGELIAISTIARDITERKRFEAQLKRLADHDPLTGLINRRRFEEELERQVARAQLYGGVGAVLMLDLDNFKYVNDSFGHRAGDALLKRVATLLEGRLRETDTIARLGGDEFAVLLPLAGERVARTVATALLDSLRGEPVTIEGRPVRATASIGYVCFGEDERSAEDVLADADRAMYLAKEAGRDRAETLAADARGNGESSGRGWEERIHEALDEGLLVLLCQPIVDLADGEVRQHELLLRMREGGELVAPGAFLGVAERLGLVHAIDRWVIGEAVRLLAARPELRLEVNLSARSLDDELVIGAIRDGLAEHAVDPGRLILEITETAALGNIDAASRFADSIADLGCPLALDDFGTGFGSFYYLKHLPVRYLKIDGDFVTSPRSQADELVIDAIVGIARGLGIETIAEHVEDGQTVDVLRAKGVDLAQGYHLGRPRPVDELVEPVAG